MTFVKAQGCNGDETVLLIDAFVHISGLLVKSQGPGETPYASLFNKNVRFRVEPGQFLFSGQFQLGNVLADVLKFYYYSFKIFPQF